MNSLLYALCRRLAWFGGGVLALISVMSVASITGRALSGLGLAPVPGDFELVEAGTALAVFCFLPWCHLTRGHAVVDMLWSQYPPGMRKVLDVLTDLLMLLVWFLLVWRMGVGLQDYHANGEVSFILQMPVWWGFAASMVPALIGCLACVWRVLESIGVVKPPPGLAAGFATVQH